MSNTMAGLILTFLIIVYMTGLSSQTCPECDCCKGEDNACNTDKFCKHGCIDGYYGDKCTYECLKSCKTCNNGSSCTECKPGYFTSNCNVICGKGCLNDTCSLQTGHCTCKTTGFEKGKCHYCSAGWYGEECLSNCPDNCGSCSSEFECSWCKNSLFHGLYCQQRCSSGCNDGMCNKGHGRCVKGCKPGFFGNSCESNCPENCSNCSSISNCSICKLGFYGVTCKESCPNGCKENCSSVEDVSKCKSECDSKGVCLLGCYDGFFGERCDRKCSSKCTEISCNQYSGECLHGCINGFEGEKCVQSSDEPYTKQTVIISASVGACVVFIILVVIFTICLIKRKQKQRESDGKERTKDMRETVEQNNKTESDALNVYAEVNKVKSIKEKTELIEVVYDTTRDNKNKQPSASNNEYAVLTVASTKPVGFDKLGGVKSEDEHDTYDTSRGYKAKNTPHLDNDYSSIRCLTDQLYDTTGEAAKESLQPVNDDYDVFREQTTS